MSYFEKETYQPDAEAKKYLKYSFIIISLILFIALFSGLFILRQLVSATQFNEVDGKVLSSRLIKHRGGKGGDLSYTPEIVYEYSIGEDKYKANQYDIINYIYDYEESNDIVNKYYVDKDIKVYIDSNNKHITVLDKDIHPYFFSIIPFASTIIFVWIMNFYMLKTGNYYILYSQRMFSANKKSLVFAYPTATGFAILCSMITTGLFGYFGNLIKYTVSWNFYILWLVAVASVYIVAYLYKQRNLRFSQRFEDMLIKSEGYKTEDTPAPCFSINSGVFKIMVVSLILIVIIMNFIFAMKIIH